MPIKFYPAVFFALAAALCYGLSAPFSKLLLNGLAPSFLASLLYIGAGLCMCGVWVFSRGQNVHEKPLSRRDIPYLTAMVLLDAAAPVLLLCGLKTTTPATVALLNNFEIAATALIARCFFREAVGRRLWLAIGLITTACIVLTVDDVRALSFSAGALLALLASVCWGFENNTTRVLSAKNPVQIVLIKGLGSGTLALVLAAGLGEISFRPGYILGALALGAAAYGCSVYLYILAQRSLGAARTGVYYAFAPFMGAALSFLLVGQPLGNGFCAAVGLMAAGTYFAVTESSAKGANNSPRNSSD